MPDRGDSLEALRRRIDAIDDRLLELLAERAEVVLGIADAKRRGPDASGVRLALRPGREAIIMRRLLDRRRGVLPAALVVRLWREIFAFTTRLQGPMEICLLDASRPCSELASFYYGAETPVRRLGSEKDVLREVAERGPAIGLLPAAGDWWTALRAAPGVAIVARLPFLSGVPAAADAFVIACMAAEPSGDDTSLIGLSLDTVADAGAIARRAGLGVARIAGRLAHGRTVEVLLEVPGFIAADDRRLKELGASARALGAYANPVRGAA